MYDGFLYIQFKNRLRKKCFELTEMHYRKRIKIQIFIYLRFF